MTFHPAPDSLLRPAPLSRSTRITRLRIELGEEEFQRLRRMWEGRRHIYTVPLIRSMTFTTFPNCHIDAEDVPYVEQRRERRENL